MSDIKRFINKKYNLNRNRENEFNIITKILTRTKNTGNKSKNRQLKIKQNNFFTQYQLNPQLKINKKFNLKEELNKYNKIKVNLKSNNSDLHKNKSIAKTIEVNNYKKDLKKIIPKLKLEGINNNIRNVKNINSKLVKDNINIYNKIAIKSNYSNNNLNIRNKKDGINDNISSINNRSESITNGNKNKICQGKITTKKKCITKQERKNYLNNINFLKKDIKILTHQRNLSSSSKQKAANINTENKLINNSNKISLLLKDNINTNKKNKVLKNNNSININNSYMNDYYVQNLKKRKNSMKSEENIINSYGYKSFNTINSLDKKNNKKIVKRTSYLAINRKYIINNNNNEIIGTNNTSHINSKRNSSIKKEYYINNNNQNVININMVLKQNKNNHKNRNINSYLISTDSVTDAPNNIIVDQSPYFTENISDDYNDKFKFKLSTLFKKNCKKKNV